jgi:hypothetical protein
MRKGSIVATAALILVAGLTFAPTAAHANRFHGGPVGGRAFVGGRAVVGGRAIVRGPVVVRPFATRPFVPRPFVRPFVHRPFFRPFVPFGVVAAPVVLYGGLPSYYSTPPAYYDSPAYYPPDVYTPPASATVAAPPAPASPATPNVVEYPHGRYELRGDGITTPYTWVWIPNPPPPPPSAPPEGSQPAPPTSSGRSPARQGQLYRWTDEQGVVHWTDSRDAVPQQYRERAKQG